jgi:hypothetical protein
MIFRYARVIALVFLLSNAFIFSGCDTKEEAIPAYIKIDKINLNVNTVIDGSASSKITDAWVYIDGNLVGVYELPCKFPVLVDEGTHDLMIKAGIKVNGIAASRAYYPFYQPIEMSVTLIPGETLELTPTTSYYADKVNYIEAFEDGGVSLEDFGDTDTSIVKTADPAVVFEGAYSGLMKMDATHDHIQVATASSYSLPKNGTPVFLEMNYKADNQFAVGIVAVTGSENVRNQIMILNPTTGWNKIYINLTPTLINNQSASTFRLYYEVYKSSSLSEASVLLDNLKLVYNE